MHLPELLQLGLGTVGDHVADASSLQWNGSEEKVVDESCELPQNYGTADGDQQLHQPTNDKEEVDTTIVAT